MSRTFRPLFFAAASAIGALFPSTALANGRYPAANQLVAMPGNAASLVLRTTFGVLVSNDAAKNWDWVCERSIGYGGIWDPPIGSFASGSLIVGTIDGLVLSPDHGCDWSYLKGAIEKRSIVDVVVRPDAPNSGLALAATSTGTDEAGASIVATEVFASSDSGATWTALAKDFSPAFVAQTIEVAKSDPTRVYVSGSTGADGSFFVSKDGGASFVEKPLTLTKPDERAPYIAAVAPNDANRVYVRTGGASSRLLVTDDGGDTFRAVFSGAPLAGFALSPDGARVWVGSTDGLFSAATSDLNFTRVATGPVQCLLATDTILYECASDPSVPYILGASSDQGKTFTPVLTLSGVRGPISCAPGATAAVCVPDWPALRDTLNPLGGDAGSSGASGSSSGGCSVSEGSAAASGTLALVAAALVMGRRRVNRRHRDG